MNIERLAIIDHETHRLYIEDVNEALIEQYGGEQEYIDDKYTFKGDYSWDYITGCDYYPDDDEPIEVEFTDLL